MNVAQINASGALTPDSANQLAVEHQRLIGVLQAVQLSSHDRIVVNEYASSLTTYDQQVQSALQLPDLQSANSALQTANAQLDAAGHSLSESLHQVPGSCTT